MALQSPVYWTRAGDGQDLTAMNFEIIAASLLPFNVVCGFCFSMSRVLKYEREKEVCRRINRKIEKLKI